MNYLMAASKRPRLFTHLLLWACVLPMMWGCVSLDYYEALREAYERSEHKKEAIKAELERTRSALAHAQEELVKNEELNKAHLALQATLKDEIAKGNSSVQRQEHAVKVILAERILYDSGSAGIKPNGLKLLQRIAEALRSSADTNIRVEGHTDDVPIRAEPAPRFASNFELSFARAMGVMRFLEEVAKVRPSRLTAVGLADTRPVIANASEDARARNRRVEIIVTR
jgi:chemotaxis protein MotB